MKHLSPEGLHAIVGKLLFDEDGFQVSERDAYGRFMTALAGLVCDFAGGRVTGPADDACGWLVSIEADDCMPDPSVFGAFDTEGDLGRGYLTQEEKGNVL
jgi:hypothetical protein